MIENDEIILKLIRSFLIQEAVAQRGSVKKVLLEISQNSQENTCARVAFSIKLQAFRCFSVNIVKFLRAPILRNICEQLLLMVAYL